MTTAPPGPGANAVPRRPAAKPLGGQVPVVFLSTSLSTASALSRERAPRKQDPQLAVAASDASEAQKRKSGSGVDEDEEPASAKLKRRYGNSLHGSSSAAPVDCQISPQERAADPFYKKEGLIVDLNDRKHLFCNTCRKQLASTKKDRLTSHIESDGHKQALQKVLAATGKKNDIKAFLLTSYPTASALPMDMRVFRFNTARMLISSGIALAKVAEHSDLCRALEAGGQSLGGRNALSELIPAILAEELQVLKQELGLSTVGGPANSQGALRRRVSITFDGATSVADVYCLLAVCKQRDNRVEGN